MTTTQPVTSLYESVISALGGPADTSLEVQLAAINVGPDAPSAALDGRAPIVRIMAIDSIAGASSPSLVDARRALLLAGREEVAFGPAVLARLLRKNALISAAALSGAALDDLKSAVENQEKQLQKYMPALVAAVQKFDAMVASGDQSQTSTCLSALDDLAAVLAVPANLRPPLRQPACAPRHGRRARRALILSVGWTKRWLRKVRYQHRPGFALRQVR